ncbi:Dimethylaniline monooxygenase [N-oxide-forming] 5 [Lamellibrachia satsuma]|nr:Dimethylaniline monooxygenase [N-oxide-forming] 5 [Lamellibrachia satsuma]
MVVKTVAVVGAGASGIGAVKACLDEGLSPVCFEQSPNVGGLWFYRDVVPPDQGCVSKTTTANTSKEMTAFSDFPMPREFPNYPHNTGMQRYMELYADHFDLRRHIRFEHEVVDVTPAADYNDTGRWLVQVKDRRSGDVTRDEYDAVMICNGHHWEPNRPRLEGEDVFKGRVIHSLQYRDHRGYEDKKVVVVGIGNTGGDIVIDLSRIAKQVYMSTRRGAWIVKRIGGGGMPMDVIGMRRVIFDIMGRMPTRWLNSLTESFVNQSFDHELYGLRPKHRFHEQHPTVNDDLPNRIACGTVIIKPNIARLTVAGVEFDDGSSEEDVDVVILATGYTFSFPFLDQSILKVKDNVVDLYRWMFPPNLEHPTLVVIGRMQQLGSVFPIVEMQSRWATRVFKGLCQLPSRDVMLADIRQRQRAREQHLPSLRHTMEVLWLPYLDELARDIGCRPNIAKLMLTDPTLAMRCYFGPAVAYQFRLQGPGKWPGAREAVLATSERIAYPLSKKRAEQLAKQRLNSGCGCFLKVLAALLVLAAVCVMWFR